MIIDSLEYNGACSCGREHKMQTVFSVVEGGCLRRIEEYLKRFGLNGYTVAVYDENTYAATADRHPKADYEVILNPDHLHANEHGVELLEEQLPKETKVLIAVGSGTVHDITRYCAYQRNIEFVSCPTAASVDGFCSSVAAMTWNGCKKTLTAVAPKIVVADLDIIKKAPLYLARSGFGDMIGKYIALTDWKIAHILTGEFYCERIYNMTLEATESVQNSAKGIADREEKAYEKLMYGLLLSGLAMQMMGNSRPASGAEHHISHIIEMSPEGLGTNSDALHGEKVGVGTLLAAREYQRIAKSKNLVFHDYESYSLEFLSRMYDESMIQDILEENSKDAAVGIKGETIKDCWPKICEEIAKIPDASELETLYRELGVKAELADIDVPKELADKLILYSPTVRNRITLMRLRRCFYEG